MALSASEVQAALLDHTYTDTDYDGEEYTGDIDGWSDWDYEVDEADIEGIGHVEVIDREGGEGQGDHCHIVFKITPSDGDPVQYFKVDGYYSSIHGKDWDYADLYEVTPKQKVITVYEK